MRNEILYRFLRCETSAEEEQQVVDWLEADKQNRRTLDALQLTMEGMSLLAPELERSLLNVRRRRRLTVGSLAQYAAAAAVMALAVIGISYYAVDTKLEEWTSKRMSFTVPAGQRIQVQLPDGTSVWLNSESTLEYPPVFTGRTRRVGISGEAMFEVAEDRDRPFVVETFACDVEVLGTKFNVNAHEKARQFSTALLRGSIKVINKSSRGEELILRPNDVVCLVDGHLFLHRIENPDDYRWPEGLISLKSDSFEDLMRKFENYYGVNIIVERKELPVLRYDGKIRISEGIDYALQILQRGSEFSYYRDKENNEIYIR